MNRRGGICKKPESTGAVGRAARCRAGAFALALALVVPLVSPAADPLVKMKLEAEESQTVRGAFLPIDAIIDIAPGWHLQAHEPNEPYLIPTTLELTLPPGVTAEETVYPPPIEKSFKFSEGKVLLVYEGRLGLATALWVDRAYPGRRVRVEARLRYQACNDTTCRPPAYVNAELIVPVAEGIVQDPVIEKAPPAARAGGQIEQWLKERGLLFTFFAVAILGLGLNLTPCVYPLISVTVAYFGGQSRTRTRVIVLALLYVLGIALSFSALGVIAAMSGGLFGAALQKPAVLGAIAALLVVLALSNFGLYQFRLPAPLTRVAGGAWHGVLGAFLMGLTMGIVAAPCVGPILLGLLVFVGTRQDVVLGFSLFLVLALGMGAPYVGLALGAGAIRQLPRSGEWLLWVERFFGCVLLALAAYFVAPLVSPPFRGLLLPVVLAVSGLYLAFIEPAGNALPRFPVFKRAAGVALLLVGVWAGLPAGRGATVNWERVPTPGVETIEITAGKPVVIEFAAEWCLPCKEMEHTTYTDADVLREAERFRMIRADITQENELTTRLVERFQVLGVPTVIVFNSDATERQRMVGYVGPEELLEAMRAAR